MKRTLLFTAALATAVGFFTLGADAQSQNNQAQVQNQNGQIQLQSQERLTVAQVAEILAGQGYTVREIELERDRYDVEMTDANGYRVEAYLNAMTGEMMPDRSDDDRAKDRDRDDRYERDDD